MWRAVLYNKAPKHPPRRRCESGKWAPLRLLQTYKKSARLCKGRRGAGEGGGGGGVMLRGWAGGGGRMGVKESRFEGEESY